MPILLIVLALGFIVTLGRTQGLTAKNRKATAALNVSIANLRATDTVACTFIVSDASTRTQQAANSNLTVVAQRRYIRKTKKVLALFASPAVRANAERQTPAQRAAALQFRDYLSSELALVQTTERQTVKNIVLATTLAATATRLAATLPCPAPPSR